MQNLAGRVAFITGGASGIGLGIAKAFRRDGIRVSSPMSRAITSMTPRARSRQKPPSTCCFASM